MIVFALIPLGRPTVPCTKSWHYFCRSDCGSGCSQVKPTAMGVPETCPNCGNILYRVPQLRPAPSFSWPARGVLAIGVLVVVLLCWALLAAVPAGARISFRGLGILLVLVGLV